MAASRYIVGVDLGTTNCAVAYVDTRGPRGHRTPMAMFDVPQLVAPGEVKPRPMLPSFLYLPGAHDLPPGSTRLAWDPHRSYAVGEFARDQGARVPGRLISSAKSWLCHPGVDRTAPILPWAGPADVPKLSPVQTSARYLQHIREAWNATIARGQAESLLENQDLVLTVPASFDEVARDLTVEAARMAGLSRFTLLEEPQAAFYAWLDAHAGDWTRHVQVGQVILVCDVGGGTTDFSLIAVDEAGGGLAFRRLAVGEHLMLGGDNQDVALARLVEGRIVGQPGKLDSVQWSGLVQSCRMAKEALLGDNPPERMVVAVPGRGSKVIGGRLQAELSRGEVLAVVLDGFLPLVPWDEEPARRTRAGLQEFGLPYVADPAIPKYLSTFLRRHRVPVPDQEALPLARPDAVLFNGGALKPAMVRQRIIEVLGTWFPAGGAAPASEPWRPAVLVSGSLDLAVARGAAHYGVVRREGGIRIGGGTARTYYVGIESPAADGLVAVCVIPRGMQEGDEVDIADREFHLTVGQPVSFPIYTSTVRMHDTPGAVVPVNDRFMDPLPPVQTTLRAGTRTSAVKTIPVTLLARYTELGTVELWCVSRQDNRRWRLQFQVRSAPPGESAGAAAAALPAGDGRSITLDETVLDEAGGLVRAAFGASVRTADPEAPRPENLTKRLEELIGLKREAWPITALRKLWESLVAVADSRRSAPGHDWRWSNLGGFCLRPGYGYPTDDFRIHQLWRLAHGGPTFGREEQCRIQWWILWRRVAGGLTTSYQEALFNRVAPILLPARSRGRKPGGPRPGPQELAEMWRAAASLERISERSKVQLGEALLKGLRRTPPAPYALWALARLGARVPLYGPLNTVVSRAAVEPWIDQLLAVPMPEPDGRAVADYRFMLVQLARRSGDRHRDIGDELRARVVDRLAALDTPDHLVRLVLEVGELDTAEQKLAFGESLPVGLRLVVEAAAEQA